MPTSIASLPPPGAPLPGDTDPSRPETVEAAAPWGADGFGFDDLLDIINPLQHIPVVSALYRGVTGDEIAEAPRLIGGALFGGVLGFIAAGVNAAIEEETGASPVGHIVAALKDLTGSDETAVAHAEPSAATPGPRPAPPGRVGTTIRAAEAAQLPLLLASLGLTPPESPDPKDQPGRASPPGTDRPPHPAEPGRPTPFELMRRALDKYEQLQSDRRRAAVDVSG